MRNEGLVLEKAKNGNYTCRYNINGKLKYLYSKYEPNKIVEQLQIKENSEFIVVLGLGLGYELNYIRTLTSKPIIVIEFDYSFYQKIKEQYTNNTSKLLKDVKLFFGEDYKQIKLNISKGQVISNQNLIQCNVQYYNKVIKYLYSFEKSSRREKIICMFEHPTILNDCLEAFEDIGYKVKRMPWSHKEILLTNIVKINPTYLFTINFSKVVSEISEILNIPYISWTVDTPAYSLYNSTNLQKKLNLFFVYDEKVVLDLKKRGINNIFYLPVAANTKRLEQVIINDEDYRKYNSEIAFVGNSGANNEFSTHIKPFISKSLNENINKIILKQFRYDTYILKDLIDDFLVEMIEKESSYTIDVKDHILLTRKEKLAFLLGRYHSFIERAETINALIRNFDVKIYGEDRWLENNKFNFNLHYGGNAEHYLEMPKIFRIAKVNLNITRAFVETGLPMRVFDVLGSKGFLVTNNKIDIYRLFKEGRELVVYRDIKDLLEICKYYLEHDNERKRIMMQGFETIKKSHTYKIRLKKMMEIVNHSLASQKFTV
jgi:spore maturation protein CgeB